jgi:mono/diheme cytochrome c family protein
MKRLFAVVWLAACTPPETSSRPAPPADHGPAFTRTHGLAVASADCARCHGPEPCVRCHRGRPPADHLPGFAGAAHAAAARLDPRRCAVCHTDSLCGRCHR